MNVSVFIYPNAGDSWTTVSPFSTLLGSGKTSFCLPVTTLTGTYSLPVPYTSVNATILSGLLLDISSIETNVSITDDLDLSQEESPSIEGVGGIATDNQVKVTLNNIDSSINVYRLLGRQIKICLIQTGTVLNQAYANTFFSGYIDEVDRGAGNLILVCRSTLSRLLDHVVGEAVGLDRETIAPIVYGDFNVNTTPAPVTMTDTVSMQNLRVSDKEVDSVERLVAYDSSAQVEALSKDSLTFENTNSIHLGSLSNAPVYLSDTILNTGNIIKVFNPLIRAFRPGSSFTSSDYDSLTCTTPTQNGDLYRFPVADNFCGELVAKVDGYLLFSTREFSGSWTLAETGTLTKVSGTGPATIPYNYRSDIPFRTIDYDFDNTIDTIGPDSNHYDVYTNVKPRPCWIQVESEVMQLMSIPTDIFVLTSPDNYPYYLHSTYNTTRDPVTKVTHNAYVNVYPRYDVDTTTINQKSAEANYNTSMLFSIKIPIVGYSNTGFVVPTNIERHVGEDIPNLLGLETSSINFVNFVFKPDSGSVHTGKRYLYTMDIVLPQVELSGTVSNMFISGNASFMVADMGNTDHPTVFMNLYINKGGKVAISNIGSYLNKDEEFWGRGRPICSLDIYENQTFPASTSWNYNYDRCYELSDRWSRYDGDRIYDSNGLVSNLSEISSARYLFENQIQTLTHTFSNPSDTYNIILSFENMAIDVDFYLNPIGRDIYWYGKGQASGESRPDYIIKDVFETYLVDEYYSVQTLVATQTDDLANLVIKGKRQNLRKSLQTLCRNAGFIIAQDLRDYIYITDIKNTSTEIVNTLSDSLILPGFTQEYSSAKSVASTLNTTYNKYLPSDSNRSSYTYNNSEALTYTGGQKVIDLNLSCLYKQETVLNKIDDFKYYLCKPVRELKVPVVLPAYPKYRIGDLVTIESLLITNTTGFVYKIIGTEYQLPIGDVTPQCILTLLELPDGSEEEELVYHEVPSSILETFEEVPESALETFEEVINV